MSHKDWAILMILITDAVVVGALLSYMYGVLDQIAERFWKDREVAD